MKKVLFLFSILVFVSACSSGEDQIRKNAEVLIKETMNNPSSYELVSFHKTGTLTVGDMIDNQKAYLEKNRTYNNMHLQTAQAAIDSTHGYLKEMEGVPNSVQEKIDQYNDDINRYNTDLNRFQERDRWFETYITDLSNLKGNVAGKLDDPVLVNYELTMKGDNGFGTLVTETAYVQADPRTKEIVNIAYSPEEMLQTYESAFPEIEAIINRHE